MSDELEPGPDPRKIRNPGSRRPSAPARVPQALRSYNEDRAFSIRKPTEAAALQVKTEITAAVYYLNRWEGYDVRARPYITQHWETGSEGALVYWKCNFWVHDPLPRGFRQMDDDSMASAHRRSASARGVTIRQGSGARRTVQERGDD